MSGDRFDYSIELQRHEKFVGRAGLLDQLDQLLVDSDVDRWVVITGGPGMGKSALLAAWLARRQAAGAVVPHHFIRRGMYDWDDPRKLVGSLVAQIEDGVPDLREPDGDERMHPATRLARALSRVSDSVLRARGVRLVIVIDGLDEYDPPAGSSTTDPLAAFLPERLPAGVRLLCASRPRHPYISSLEARDVELTQIDLDEPSWAADNDATVRAFWNAAARSLGLDAAFVDDAVERAGGNVQHAVQLRKQLANRPADPRRVEDIPRGLAALIERVWERIAIDPAVVAGLGSLCAAYEPLTLDDLATVAGWTEDIQRRIFVRAAKEWLVEMRRPSGQLEYRLHHDSIRGHIRAAIGDVALGKRHAALARCHARWPVSDAVPRRYALRYGLLHRAEAGDWADAWQLASDMSFLEAKCRELGAHETEVDVVRVAERCGARGDTVLSSRFGDLSRALGRDSHWLRLCPEATPALVWNRLRRTGWSASQLDRELRNLAPASFLRVRHAVTRESSALIRDLVGHAGSVLACAVTPDGRRLVSASHDQTLKVWDLETGRPLATLEGHAYTVTACAVTPDGRRVVSASEDRTLKVWDLETGRPLATLEGHAYTVTACAVAPDGRRVVSASRDHTLKVWDLETGRPLATLEGHAYGVTACAATPDGRRVVSASEDQTLKVWDLETGRPLATLEGHAHEVTACAVTPDSRRVVSASRDQTLKVWDLETGRPLATLEGHTHGVTACAVMPDGRRVISASHYKTLKVWDLQAGRSLAILEGHTHWVAACVMTPDGRCVVSASHDKTLKVWDLGTGQPLFTLERHAHAVTACAVTPDGRRVVSASHDKTLKVWDLESRRPLATLEGHAGWVTACAVTPDGRRVVSASEDQTLKVWDLETGRPLVTLKGHAQWVTACVVTPDGRRVVSASFDHMLKVWDLETGRPLATLQGHTHWVTACAVTPDGRRVVSASWDHTLKLWDLETGRPLATLQGHAHAVTACAVTPDGRLAISASWDHTLKLWDLESGVCLLTHHGDTAYTAVVAAARGVVAGDVAGGIWFLDRPLPEHRATHVDIGGEPLPQHDIRSPSDIRPSRATMKRHTILFLAANPTELSSLALDAEARAVQIELERSGYRDCFDLQTRWAVQPLDLLRELRRLKPTVVHFSGHGGRRPTGAAELDRPQHRDVNVGGETVDPPVPGLFFQSADGRAQLVTAQGLQDTFGAAGASVQLVVLSACHSDLQADALRAHVDCVVGMTGAVGDDAARHFATGFYGGLGDGESIAAAFRQGCAAIALEGLPDRDRPQLRVRDGVDASKLVLGVTMH